MGILLPQDPHPPQKALFCQKIESNEVVCSIERFDLLALHYNLTGQDDISKVMVLSQIAKGLVDIILEVIPLEAKFL